MPAPDLEAILERLARAGVDFVVIGGYAAVAHGSPLMTKDLDVCMDFGPGNLARLGSALAGLAPAHRMVPARPPLVIPPGGTGGFRNLYLDTASGQLDCLSEVIAVGPFPSVKARSIVILLPFGEVRVLDLDALIATKEALGRPRDLEAARVLREIGRRQGGGS